MLSREPIDETIREMRDNPKRDLARSERGTLMDEHRRLRSLHDSDPDMGAEEAHARMMQLDDERDALEAEEAPEALEALAALNAREAHLRDDSNPRNGGELRKLAEERRLHLRKMKHGKRLAEISADRDGQKMRLALADRDMERLDVLNRLAAEGRLPA
jgi:hypothetical protein